MESRFLAILKRDGQAFMETPYKDYAVWIERGVVIGNLTKESGGAQLTFDTPEQAEAWLQAEGVDTDSTGWF